MERPAQGRSVSSGHGLNRAVWPQGLSYRPHTVIRCLGFPGAQGQRFCLLMQQTRERWLGTLGQEDPLEWEMAICSSTLAWKIPRTEEPGGLQSVGSQRAGHKQGG